METLWFNELPSTQLYLIEQIREKRVTAPIAVVAKRQTNGIGSRDNSWIGEEGNLFLSFSIELSSLPKDLPVSSASIYFAFIMREVIGRLKSGVWLKWPNDIYYGDDKVGGVITKSINGTLICGVGININSSLEEFSSLNLNVEVESVVDSYFKELDRWRSWREIFKLYSSEFSMSRELFAHIDGEYRSLKDAELSEDGSLIIGDKRIYSLR